MATKSRVRKKNGKPVKYKPKPTGLSKTKMKKLMEMIEQQQKLSQDNTGIVPETRETDGELLISPDFTKKLNVISADAVKEGPVLYNEIESVDTQENISDEINEDSVEEQGPLSSEI